MTEWTRYRKDPRKNSHTLRKCLVLKQRGNVSILDLMKLLKKGPERQLRAHNSQDHQEQVRQQSVHYNDK